ncbi:hypothetical protein HID58_081484 [Brassica napus]|uniref:Tr-type G domain-containing protein n=1 Tax=Brassica napus TaxID=3708 RepID=A0ABQ7Y7U2_BRANA|nr:hypothetical protein HID58_081484 [Brassica napus]
MDRKNTSACRGDEDHPFALSSKGGENPKNKSYNVRFDLLGIEDYEEETGDDLTKKLILRVMMLGKPRGVRKRRRTRVERLHIKKKILDKILAELGITPVSPAQPELVPPAEDGSKDGEEETVVEEKEKKDKDNKVSASSVEAKDGPSQPHKKVPKHILEMQEMVARRKEAEEMKKKEEEEKLRKEEEERRIQEERERGAEEIKQKRKIREKEKMLKKKQEGGILTEKQKRDKAYKNKMLSDAGMLLASDKNTDSSKRPVYGNKRKPARAKENDSASVLTKEKHADVVPSPEPDKKEEAGDEEDDWEAKSDDSVNIMGDYDDDGEDTPWLVIKKEIKDTASKAHYSVGINTGPVTDRLALKAGVSCKPQKSKPKMDDATKRSNDDSVVNEVAKESLRSPICCIMGHVDTGKTKLLDCIRGTNVQEGEAGGITQQIGATYFPAENIRERTKELRPDAKLKVPGLLVIDTPGHESFSNLRSRGSNLCDIAILVVDIMHGLEPQTIESLNLLRKRNTEFIVALNKVDRLYGWKTCKNAPIEKALALQSKDVVIEFNMRLTHVITQFKEQGLNTEIYYKNKEMGDTFSIVPTSAISGEGIPDLLLYLVMWSQKTMVEKLTFVDKVQCTVLEVKVIPGHGTTIDVILVNGVLHEGDQIVACGSQGPIITTVRSLLTPHPMKELRVKGTYLHHRKVKAAQCIKITAQGLEHAVAGTSLHVIGPDVDIEEAKKTAMEDMKSIMSWVGTPICFLKEIGKSRVFLDLGRVASIHKDKKPLDDAKKGQQVAIKIIASNPGEEKTFGEDFGIEDELVSHISRRSIDILKTLYRDELKSEFKLVLKLKMLFKIQ